MQRLTLAEAAELLRLVRELSIAIRTGKPTRADALTEEVCGFLDRRRSVTRPTIVLEVSADEWDLFKNVEASEDTE